MFHVLTPCGFMPIFSHYACPFVVNSSSLSAWVGHDLGAQRRKISPNGSHTPDPWPTAVGESRWRGLASRGSAGGGPDASSWRLFPWSTVPAIDIEFDQSTQVCSQGGTGMGMVGDSFCCIPHGASHSRITSDTAGHGVIRFLSNLIAAPSTWRW